MKKLIKGIILLFISVFSINTSYAEDGKIYSGYNCQVIEPNGAIEYHWGVALNPSPRTQVFRCSVTRDEGEIAEAKVRVLDNSPDKDVRCLLASVRYIQGGVAIGSYRSHWREGDWVTTKHGRDFESELSFNPGPEFMGSALLKFDRIDNPDSTFMPDEVYYMMDCWIPGVSGEVRELNGYSCTNPGDRCSGVVWYRIGEND